MNKLVMRLDDLVAVSRKDRVIVTAACTELTVAYRKCPRNLQMMLKFQCSVAARVSIWGVSLKL